MTAHETRLDRMVKWFKNNRLFSILLLCTVIVVGASQLVGAISALIDAGREVVTSSHPGDVAVDSKPHATLLKRIGSSGTGLGFFNDARFLMHLGDREIVVGEYMGRARIQRFRADGTALGQWYLRETTDGGYPHTLSATRDGRLVVGDNATIRQYDVKSGLLIKEAELGPWADFNVIATGTPNDGNIVVVYAFKDDLFICNDINSLKNCLPLKIPSGYIQTSLSDWHSRIAVDGDENLYLINNRGSFVYKFSKQGEFLNRFGGEGMGAGLMHMPLAIAVDGKGLVYVDDGNGLQIFDNTGRFIATITLPGLQGVYAVYDMAFDQDHNLWTMSQDKLSQYEINIPSN